MRIVHYYHWALRGDFGTSIAVRGWCQAVAAAGEDVALLTAVDGAVATPPAGIELLPVAAAPADLAMPGSLGRAFDGADVVVLHGGWDVRNVTAAAAARRAKVPYLVTPHGAYYPQVFDRRKIMLKRAWWSAIERRYLRSARGAHLFFEEEAPHLVGRGVTLPLVIAPNGFVAPHGVTWRPGEDPYLLWLGRYDPQHKGLDLLIEALSLVPPPERIPVRLHGVDWHGKRSVVSALVRDRGLDGSVTVEGPIYGDEKWELMAGARGFLYPSRWDASPIAVVEAASIGVPTLVTPFPVGSFLASRGAAIQAEPTPDALARGLRALLEPGSSAVGARAVEVIRDELSWARVADTWRTQVHAMLLDGAGTVGTEA